MKLQQFILPFSLLTTAVYVLLCWLIAERFVLPWDPVRRLEMTESPRPLYDTNQSLGSAKMGITPTEQEKEPVNYEPQGDVIDVVWRAARVTNHFINEGDDGRWTLRQFYDDLDVLKGVAWPEMCPVPLKLDRGQSHRDSWHINPAAINWVDAQLSYVLKMDGFVSQTQQVFRDRLARPLLAHWDAHQVLSAFPEERILAQREYMERVGPWNMASLLADGFLEKYRFWKEMGRVDVDHRGRIVFFWLRRYEDGSAEKVSSLMAKILEAYGVTLDKPESLPLMVPVVPLPSPTPSSMLRDKIEGLLGR